MIAVTRVMITSEMLKDYDVQITYVRPSDTKLLKTRVYVADDITNDADETLRALHEAEEALGDRRFATRGKYREVDALYDRLNRRIAAVKREIAVAFVNDMWGEVLGGAPVRGNFSRKAGCSCPCSPGVVLNRRLFVGKYVLQLWIVKKKVMA